MKYLFWDTETTGLSFSDEVLQIGGVLTDESFQIIDVINFYCDTVCPINPSAAKVNHLTFELVHTLSDGKTFEDNWFPLIEKIGSDVCWIGWNDSFDRRMVNQTLKKIGLTPYNFGKSIKSLSSASGICNYDLMRGIGDLKYNGRKVKLVNAVSSLLNIPFSTIDELYNRNIKRFNIEAGAHNADYDAFLCYLLFVGVMYGNI